MAVRRINGPIKLKGGGKTANEIILPLIQKSMGGDVKPCFAATGFRSSKNFDKILGGMQIDPSEAIVKGKSGPEKKKKAKVLK